MYIVYDLYVYTLYCTYVDLPSILLGEQQSYFSDMFSSH